MRKAFRTIACGISSIVSADSRSQAVYITHKSAHEIGYKVDWREIRATRAPEFDEWAALDETRCPWDERYLHNCRS